MKYLSELRGARFKIRDPVEVFVGFAPIVVWRAGREAVLLFQWRVIFNPIHQVEVAHFVLICGTAIVDEFFFKIKATESKLFF